MIAGPGEHPTSTSYRSTEAERQLNTGLFDCRIVVPVFEKDQLTLDPSV